MKDENKNKAQLVAELAAERQRRLKLEAAHRESDRRFRRLVENAPDIIFRLNLLPSPHLEYLSPAIEQITGYSPEMFYKDPAFGVSLVHPEDRHLLTSQSTAPPPSDEPIVYRLLSSTGKEVWLEQRYIVITDDHENPVAVEGIARDRTEQVLGRAALQRSLHEKELLLKEIHHRVKNNLTLVSSLLELQASKSEDEQLREMLAISRKRLLSVARIHDALCQSEDLGQIDLKAYVIRLGDEFAEALGSTCTSIRYDLEEVTVAMSHAVQFGLILNELVSNAFKHAFPVEYQAEPSIEIRLRTSSAGIEPTVKDNGIGLPPDFSLHDTKSLGLQIVCMLTEQLGGGVMFSSSPGVGTSFTVTVPSADGDGADAVPLTADVGIEHKDPSR
jgi:PAS domain S-box-containing protein